MQKDVNFIFLNQKELKSLWSMEETLPVVEEILRLIGEGEVEQIHSDVINEGQSGFSFILPHPAHIIPWKVAGNKWSGLNAGNPAKGLPYSIGVTIINEPETLAPLAVMDAGFITTMRTAGMAAIGAKYLARKESKVLAIIGCGRQARTHLEALLKLDRFKFEEVRIFDINENAMEVYKNDMEKNFGVPIKKMTSAESAVKEADIVCPVTSFREPMIFDEWLKPGSHLAATCLYDVDIKHVLPNVDKWVLGNTERDRRWFETEEAKRKFNLSIDQIYGDLSEIVCGKKQGRQDEKERTTMTHLGMGAMDVSCAFKAYEKAKKQNIGTKLSLFGGSVL